MNGRNEYLVKREIPTRIYWCEIGVIGDPTKASKKKGKVYIEKIAEFLTDEIKKDL